MRFFVYKVIFTSTEAKKGLYTRPILAEQVQSTVTCNHMGVGAADRICWLPKQGESGHWEVAITR
jgi:hypothetical protein